MSLRPDSQRPPKVSFINRLPIEGFYSLEGYFQRISAALASLGVSVDSHTSPYPSRGLIPRLKIARFASRHQADITHITGDIHFAALATDPERTVVTVADCGRLHQVGGLKRELLRQIWFERPLTRVAAVTVISQAVKEDLLTWVPTLEPARVHVVPVSISPRFTYSPKPFNRDHPRILQVGSTPNKNIPRLAAAMRGMNATLVLIGKLNQELEQVLAEHEIQVENHRDISEQQVVELYRSADLLAFTSTLEGFGMPILEAQAIGRPVVTSNCTSMPEVAGAGALLVDPYSVDSIRAGLLRVIEAADERELLIARGQDNSQRFVADTIAAQYLEIYQSLSPLG